MCLYLLIEYYVYIAGTIPSELCGLDYDLELNVEGTEIHCYTGCLTSQNIDINGASPTCTYGDVLERFIIVMSSYMFIAVLTAIWYRWYRNSTYLTCTINCCNGPPSTNVVIVFVLRYCSCDIILLFTLFF